MIFNLSKLFSIVSTAFLVFVGALPPHPLNTWDPADHQIKVHNAWVDRIREAINTKDFGFLKPEHLIAHDKFNVADGFNADLIMVEEIQFKGDPVIAVEKEMDKIREQLRAKESKKKEKKKRGWGWKETTKEKEK